VTATAPHETITFSFGKNWEQFVQANFSDERVAIAQKHILGFLGMADLRAKTFLDIGSGSGLHSLAAWRSGAARVVSFDLDPYSVSTTRKLRELAGNPDNWQVLQGSILDEQFLQTIEPADIVYSWGVLHHTGQMWRAVENAATFIRPGGLFYIALYNTHPLSDYWLRRKKKYNRAGRIGKCWMEASVVVITTAYALLRGRNPFREMLTYKKTRGMSYMTDIRDWLGGYPYEHARPGETLRFGVEKLGLQLINLEVGQGASAVTEYLFRKP